MAQGLINGSTLTAIADKIRTLIGTTAKMKPSAMDNNINTAITAVESAKTAITEKGVTVPDSADVTDLATYIGQIVTGHPLASGSKTLSSNATSMSITHNLGVEPAGIIIMHNTTKSGSSASVYVSYATNLKSSINLIASGNPGSGTGTWTLSTSTAKLALDKVTITSSSVQAYFLGGTYLYVIWG